MNKIKILYLGAFGTHCSDQYRVKGLENSGLYDVVGVIDYRDCHKHHGEMFATHILDVITDNEPDVVLMNKAELITGEMIKAWKHHQPNVIFTYWYGDMRNKLADYVVDKLPFVDAFFTNCTEESYLQSISDQGIDRDKIFYSHTATDIETFKPMDEEKMYDIAFFGGNYYKKFDHSAFRTDFIKRLAQSGKYSIKLFGNNWKNIHHNVSKPVYGEDFAREASRAKIILGFSSFIDRDMYTSNRIWNSMACGFYMCHKFKGIEWPFTNDIHLSWFTTYEEMVEKIDYYLDHPVERQEVFETGRNEVLMNHTYLHRAVEMYPIFKQIMNRKEHVEA